MTTNEDEANDDYSAIAIGTAFSHVNSFIVTAPVIGAACKKAREADTKEEFLKSKEAAGALCVNTNSLVTSALRSYAVAVLLNKTGASNLCAATCVGGLVFTISALPSILTNAIVEKRPLDSVLAKTLEAAIDTVGLCAVLTWWGVNEVPVLNKV
ncbi:hypothetical protein TRICI_004729 [Trichomonascus ciferrii]|uniref:DUF1761 domain-containing protein n=1 Tax=Trichomonascus ciferrii TaxID=44093 RepID=A0A642V1Q0_9ASCO|nr:hypothetical protein TRICI_004729 [Trichomonascus ciferrii]